MRFQVRDLLRLNILERAKVIAGAGGLGREISGVTIIEAPDIAKYINGGEVLLTSLYPFSACSDEEYQDYVRQLCEKGISAVILKVGRNIKSAGRLTSFLLSELDRSNIPVIEIPLDIAYKDITYPIMERLFNEEVTKLKYFKETHDRFMSLSLAPPFSGSGFKKILFSLSELIGNPVALFDRHLSCVVTTDKSITRLELPQQPRELELSARSKYACIKSSGFYGGKDAAPYEQIIVPLNKATFNINMYLAITEVNSLIEQLDYIAIENAVTAILLEFTKHRTVLEHEIEFKNNIFGQILSGKIRSRDKLNLNANLLHLPLGASYCVLSFGIIDNSAKTDACDSQIQINKLLYEAIAMHFDNIHVQHNSNNIVVLQEIDSGRAGGYADYVKEKAHKVRLNVCGNRNSCVVSVGIGSLVSGVERIYKSFKEANDTLFLLETIGSLISSDGSRVACFSDLGIMKMFTYFDDPAVLDDFVPDALKKLYEYRRPQRDDLLNTLQSYLGNDRNISKTAQELFVHNKTVNYRVNKIASITGIDFNNADQVLSMRMGLILLKLAENHSKGNL